MMLNKKICAVLFLSVVFVSCYVKHRDAALPYYTSAEFTPMWLDAKDADTMHAIPAFKFIDQDERVVTRETFDNKITVVDFFFTSCPGICKKLTSSLAKVQEAFKNDDDVLLLSHSVTPERDSIPVLKTYAAEHDVISGKWHLVTGKRSDIYSIARTGYFADEDMGWKQDSTTFLHTENVLLVDKHHHIRGVYKGTIPGDVEDLIEDIKKLKEKE